jgi:hypothetical protein
MKNKGSYFLTLLILLVSFGSFSQNKKIIYREGSPVIKGELIAKIKTENRGVFYKKEFSGTAIEALLKKFNVISIERKFPQVIRPRFKSNNHGESLVDLTGVYTISFKQDFNEFDVAKIFHASGMFDYVEAQIVPELMYVPNDPKIGDQYHLDIINIFQAWDIQKGDTNIVIGIVDTGIDSDHPEVVGRIKHNYNDPIDGIDNDLDGYIDNYSGWDTGTEDNDPEVYGHHGNQVTGCASINTDNGADIAASGFNTMILPIKICNNSGYLVGAYEGIIYAADHGADIINCSWGAIGLFNQYHQDVVNYATNNKGSVVVAAAGNNNTSAYFYPASYANVISVGGTTAEDKKWVYSATEGSQYNDKIDVVAPSNKIVSIVRGGGSGLIGGGTSFACPIVSGVLALIKAQYPNASPQKLSAILKITTDDISGVEGNDAYEGMLGTGRVNALKALSPINTPFITYVNHKTDDGFDQDLAGGDTVLMLIDLKNHLGAASNLSVLLRSEDQNSTVIDSISFVSLIGSNEIKTTESYFKFVINSNLETSQFVTFKLEITDGINTFFDDFSVEINKDYVDIMTNNIYLSFSNYGKIGYSLGGSGLGVEYKNSGSLISDMGVLLAINRDTVLSYEDYELLSFDSPIVNTLNSLSTSDAKYTVTGTLRDSWSPNPVGVEVKQTAYAWDTENNRDYVIYEYVIKNQSEIDLDSIYFGVFSDWDIGEKTSNISDFDYTNNIGYVYEEGGIYGGVKLLRSNKSNYYAFDKSGNDGINISDAFDDNEEYMSMTNSINHSRVSGDVANITSSGPYSLKSNDSVVIAFAILGGNDLSSLKYNANNAELMYNKMRGINIVLNEVSNVTCFNDSNGVIDLNIQLSYPPYEVLWTHDSSQVETGIFDLKAGSYKIEVTDKYGISKHMNFAITEPNELNADLLAVQDATCADTQDGSIDLDVSGGNGSYYYKWNDPKIPNIKNPYLSQGNYQLEVSDLNGCRDSVFVIIESPDSLSLFKSTYLNDTSNTCEGELTVDARGGIGPYMYFSGGELNVFDNVFDNLCKGLIDITVEDANGCELTKTYEIKSPEISETINSSTDLLSDFTFYPNPSDVFVTAEFSLPAPQNISISILDAGGKLIQIINVTKSQSDVYKIVLNTSQFSNGNYYLNVNTNQGISSKQFQVYH